MPGTASWWPPPPAAPASSSAPSGGGSRAPPRRGPERRMAVSQTEGRAVMFQGFDWIQAMSRSPVMVLILTLSVVTLGFAIERLIYYGRRGGHAERVFSHAFERARRGDIKEAIFGCGLSPHPFGRVAAEVLGNADASPEAREEVLQIAISEQRLLLERN